MLVHISSFSYHENAFFYIATPKMFYFPKIVTSEPKVQREGPSRQSITTECNASIKIILIRTGIEPTPRCQRGLKRSRRRKRAQILGGLRGLGAVGTPLVRGLRQSVAFIHQQLFKQVRESNLLSEPS